MKKLLSIALLATLPVAANTFHGAYAGINAGMTQRSQKLIQDDAELSLSKASPSFGAQVGYGHTLDNKMYLGAELDFGFAPSKSKKTSKGTLGAATIVGAASSKMGYKAAISARAGYNFGCTIGYVGAFVGMENYKVKASSEITLGNVVRKELISKNVTTFAYGPLLGVAYSVSDTLSVGLEGRYSIEGRKKYKKDAITIKTKGYDAAVRLNYAF
ncbi:MAG: porin family protein [Alphaproteobacteria bacterium]|nr:MAG: porin family protein [Alphaproteobacteria bacterium]